MKYLDLFTGYGGFTIGIEKAYETIRNTNVSKVGGGKKVKKRDDANGERLYPVSNERTKIIENRNNELFNPSSDERQPNCIGFSEVDKYAIQVYQKHYPEHKNYGDITKLNPKDLPDFDLLTGGFPCQAFSIAGKRAGFEDTRGTLIYDVFRIIKEKHPKLVLLENVKGLLSHDNGRTFKTIITSLADLGYAVEWQVLNAKNFGVPQNRERVFIIGHLGGFGGRAVFPIRENDCEDIVLPTITTRITTDSNGTYVGQRPKNQELKYIGAVMSEKNKKWIKDGKKLSRNFPQGQRVYSADGISATLASQAGGLGAKTGLYAVKIPEATKKGYTEARVGQSINLAIPSSKTRRGRVSDLAQTVDTGMQQHTLTKEMKIRRLTPTECERLMGLSDGWTAEGTEGKISDTQRYKLCGNGVVTNVVEEIVRRLLK
jgi:DNA (cytosine-5)-methyltransferase 1